MISRLHFIGRTQNYAESINLKSDIIVRIRRGIVLTKRCLFSLRRLLLSTQIFLKTALITKDEIKLLVKKGQESCTIVWTSIHSWENPHRDTTNKRVYETGDLPTNHKLYSINQDLPMIKMYITEIHHPVSNRQANFKVETGNTWNSNQNM